MSAPLDITEEEVYVAPFKGWRVWNIGPALPIVRLDDGKAIGPDLVMMKYPPPWRLRSMFSGEVWPVKEPLRRRCLCNLKEGRLREDREHSCGIYAFRELQSIVPHLIIALAEGGRGRQLPADHILVLGEVSLWGEVYVHEEGYRGEFAYPEKVYFIEGFGRNGYSEAGMRDYGIEAGNISLFSLVYGREHEIFLRMPLHGRMIDGGIVGILEEAFLAVGSELRHQYLRRDRSFFEPF